MEKDQDSEDNATALFKVFDADDNGTMDFVEFLMATNARLKLFLFMIKTPFEMKKIEIQHLIVRVRQPKETS